MSLRENWQEIEPIKMLDEEIAVELGKAMLFFGREFIDRTALPKDVSVGITVLKNELETTKLLPHGNTVLLGNEYSGIYDDVLSEFDILARNYYFECEDEIKDDEIKIESDFYIGTAFEGEWHVDEYIDLRMLVNLSDSPARLDYGLVWDADNYDPNALSTNRTPVDPEQFATAIYYPGEAIILDNQREVSDQIPHRGFDVEDKILLRVMGQT